MPDPAKVVATILPCAPTTATSLGHVSEILQATSPRLSSRGEQRSSEHILRRIPAFSFLEMSNGLSMVEFLSGGYLLFSVD